MRRIRAVGEVAEFRRHVSEALPLRPHPLAEPDRELLHLLVRLLRAAEEQDVRRLRDAGVPVLAVEADSDQAFDDGAAPAPLGLRLRLLGLALGGHPRSIPERWTGGASRRTTEGATESPPRRAEVASRTA
jgi:hypothetical protein